MLVKADTFTEGCRPKIADGIQVRPIAGSGSYHSAYRVVLSKMLRRCARVRSVSARDMRPLLRLGASIDCCRQHGAVEACGMVRISFEPTSQCTSSAVNILVRSCGLL